MDNGNDIILSNNSTDFLKEGADEIHIPVYVGIYIAVINTIIFTTGIVCNFLVIVVLLCFKSTNNTISMYLVNLGVADLCVLFVCQPVATIEYFNKERWFLGSAVCKLVPVLESAAQHASTLTTLAITLERMNAVCKPFRAFTKKNRRSRVLIPLIWITSIALASPFAGIADTVEVQFMNGSFDTICNAPLDSKWKRYFIVGGILFFLILIIGMALMHVQIIRKLVNSAYLRRTSDGFTVQRSYSGLSSFVNSPTDNSIRSFISFYKDGRTSVSDGDNPVGKNRSSSVSRQSIFIADTHNSQIKRLVFIVVFLFVAYMPMRVFILWQMYTQKQPSDIGVESYLNIIWAFRFLIYLHSASNPFIYSFMSTKFMQSFNRMVNCGKRPGGRYVGR